MRTRIKKIDAIRLAGNNEVTFDAQRKQAASENRPIATLDQGVLLDFMPVGNAGYYELQGNGDAIQAILEKHNIIPLNPSKPTAAAEPVEATA